MAKAFDGAVELQRHLPTVGRPNAEPNVTSPDHCFDWLLPMNESTPARTRFARVGEALTLNFSLVFLCNKSLDVIHVNWRRADLPTASTNTSLQSSYVVDVLPTPQEADNSAAGGESLHSRCFCCSELNRTCVKVSDDVTVTCFGAPLDDVGCVYHVDVKLSAVGRYHAGAYSVAFAGGSQSVSYNVELVVLGGGASPDAEAPFRLRMRTCSNATWVGSDVSGLIEYRLRQLVPDCVRCEASGGSSIIDVQLLRSDGLILGSEDAHSVYWYRDGRRAHVVVLLLRAPSDDYTAEYYCVASTSGSLRPGIDAKKRRLTRKFVRRIRFRLTVR